MFKSWGDYEKHWHQGEKKQKNGEEWEGGWRRAASCLCSWSLVGTTGKGVVPQCHCFCRERQRARTVRKRQQRRINEHWGFSQHRYACLPAWFPLQTKVMPFPIEITTEVGVRAFWIPVTSHTFFNLTAQGILLWSFCEGLDKNWGKSKQRGGNGSKKSELEDKKRGGRGKTSKLMDWIKMMLNLSCKLCMQHIKQ